MRVLHIIDHIGLGGTQTVIRGVFESQRRSKNIFLLSLRKKDVNIKINHSNVIILNKKNKYSLAPLKEAKNLIKNKEIDALHCHLFRSQVFGWILKRFYFPEIKLIMHEHGQIFQNNWYYELFIKIAKKRINLFIAVSKATRERLIKKASISKDKIKILYNFVDLDRFNKVNITWDVKKEKEKLGAEKDFVIGFVGRLSEVKGCEYLIRSLPYLRFNYKVVIVGDGPLREKLKNLSLKLELSENVIFIGYSEKMIKYFSLMNILVVPSLSESFGISAVEAQALEIPVTASNVPALNEIINNENGMLFEAKNPKDLSQKINKLYKNQKLRKELVKNGLKNAKKFDLNNYVAKLNQLYHEK